jgi:dienelactone hydrolase
MHRFMTVLAVVCGMAAMARAEIRTQVQEYYDGQTVLRGYVAYDDAIQDKRPGVLVIPEWWGLTDYAKHRCEQLAKLGYVAFAADMYGQGQTTDSPDQAGKWSAPFIKDRALMRTRANLALDILRQQRYTDPQRIAAIGYCFGGTGVLELARSGASVAGVVCFHGNLSNPNPKDDDNIKCKVLVCQGAADKFVPQKAVDAFWDEMSKTDVDWQLILYSGAEHAFTNPDADMYHLPGIGYNANADHRSWDTMMNFFKEIFAVEK